MELSTLLKTIPKNVKLIAVSKNQPISKIIDLYNQGQRDFGENKAQELFEKSSKLSLPNIKWHFIGNLQSNKLNKILNVKDCVLTVGSLKIAEEICKKAKDPVTVFIQINVSEEEQKHGCNKTEAEEILKLSILNSNLHILGLMMIGTKGDQEFSSLRTIRDELSAKFNISLKLNMGMSSDYIQAIEHGSDYIRIGTLLFGDR